MFSLNYVHQQSSDSEMEIEILNTNRPTMVNRVPILTATSATALPKAPAKRKQAPRTSRNIFKKPLPAPKRKLNSNGTLQKGTMVQKTLKNMWNRAKASTPQTIEKKHAGLKRKNPFNSESKRKPDAFIQFDFDVNEVRF